MISRALLIALCWAYAATSLTPLSSPDDEECALYLTGPGRSSAYDYTLNLLKGNFGYDGQHTCITYEAVNQAYLDARSRILVSQPKGDWGPEDMASVGELILDISISLARTYGLNYEEIEKGLPLIDTSRTLIREVCPPVFSRVECRPGKYRRLDGLCNNQHRPTWGATMAPFQRLIGPLFADGINAPRISHTGRDLPLSRVVSRTMHPDDGFHDHAGTVMVIAWGQFMDHDYTLTGTPLDPLHRNDPEECCKRPPHLKHPYCNEIRIPDDDHFYRLFGVKCIDFVRGFPSPRPGCRLGSRVPFNTLTGAIDGNTVYGVTEKFSRKLRTGYGGLLRMNPVFKEYGLKDLLPLKLDIPDEGCTRPNKNMYCFEAGEIRVNEQLVLTVMHTLMAREHNRVAHALAAVNPHWDDETLFQEARRINIAEIQHITYNEFLPILLGKDVMEKFGLVLEKNGYWDGYDPEVNPDVLDAFAAAAYRFGHSLLPTAVERWSKAHKFIASKRLSDLIRRPYDLYRAGVLDEYVMGLMNQVAQAMDDSITQEVTNHLFKKVGARFGMDLVSFNMQRGREFGLPGYMEFRKFCGLSGADNFQDLFGSMPNNTIRRYESIFEHPIDVDLWSGGVSERPLPGSMLGPTFACIIATQFSYSRRGDRFWFELPNQPSSFTPEQMVEIRKSRLARIICDNTDIIDTVQLYPMVLPDHELNPRVPCRSGVLPSMDFSKWAEPAPQFGAAKQYVTEAIITNLSVNDSLNTSNSSCKGYSLKEGLNNGTACQVPEDLKYNLKLNSTLENNAASITMKAISQPTTVAYKTPNKDTLLKYIYKNSKKEGMQIKTSGPSLNTLRRKKRSEIIQENTNYIVPGNSMFAIYHKDKEEIEELQNKGVIQKADLADFNIETLHVNVEPKNDFILKHNMESDERNTDKEINSYSGDTPTYENHDELSTTEQTDKNVQENNEESEEILEEYTENKSLDSKFVAKEKQNSSDSGNKLEYDSNENNSEEKILKSPISKNFLSKTTMKPLLEVDLDDFKEDKYYDNDKSKQTKYGLNLNFSANTSIIKPIEEDKSKLYHEVYSPDNEDSSETLLNYSHEDKQQVTAKEAVTEITNKDTNDIVGKKINKIIQDPEITDQNDDVNRKEDKISTEVKAQFERIPLNYKYQKETNEEEFVSQPLGKSTSKQNNNDDNENKESSGEMPLKENKYDENLNFKFGDLSLKLPEIKLPYDILDYVDQSLDRNDDENSNEILNEKIQEIYEDDDSNNNSNEDLDNNLKKTKFSENVHNKPSRGEYNKDDITADNDDEDLYDKFVRERFSKRLSEKKSEKINANSIFQNQELFNILQNVLNKTKEVQKEADDSSDPKGGYMWTLEYGENL